MGKKPAKCTDVIINGTAKASVVPDATSYRANFLWPPKEGSVNEAGYEFANARTEEFRKQWWKILLARARATPLVIVLLFICSIASAQDFPVGPAAKLQVRGASLKLTVDGNTLAGGSTQGGATLKYTAHDGWLECEVTGMTGEARNYPFGLFSAPDSMNHCDVPQSKRVGPVVAGEWVYGILPLDYVTAIATSTGGDDGVYIASPKVMAGQRFALYVCKADHDELICLMDEIEVLMDRYCVQVCKASPENRQLNWFLMPDGGGGDRPKSSEVIAAVKELGGARVTLSSGFWMKQKDPDHPMEPYGWNEPYDPTSFNVDKGGWSVAQFIKDLADAGVEVELHTTVVHWPRGSAITKLYGPWVDDNTEPDVIGYLRPATPQLVYKEGWLMGETYAKIYRFCNGLNPIGLYIDALNPTHRNVQWGYEMDGQFIAGLLDALKFYRVQLKIFGDGGHAPWLGSYKPYWDWKFADDRFGYRTLEQTIAWYPSNADPWGLTTLQKGWFNIAHMYDPRTKTQDWVTPAQLRQWLAMPGIDGLSMSLSEWKEIKRKPEYYGAIMAARYPTKEALIQGLLSGTIDGRYIQTWVDARR